jgi:hypothetical protein
MTNMPYGGKRIKYHLLPYCHRGAEMGEAEIEREYDDIIKRAIAHPGIAELMEVYGQYDLLLKQSSEYLSSARPKTIITTTNSSI